MTTTKCLQNRKKAKNLIDFEKFDDYNKKKSDNFFKNKFTY